MPCVLLVFVLVRGLVDAMCFTGVCPSPGCCLLKGELSPKIKCGKYDKATPEKFFGVSLAYVRSLEGSQKAG